MRIEWASMSLLPPSNATKSNPVDLQYFFACLQVYDNLTPQFNRHKQDLPPHVGWWLEGGRLRFWHVMYSMHSFLLRWPDSPTGKIQDHYANKQNLTLPEMSIETRIGRLQKIQSLYEREIARTEDSEAGPDLKLQFMECAANNWHLICSSSWWLQYTSIEVRTKIGKELIQVR